MTIIPAGGPIRKWLDEQSSVLGAIAAIVGILGVVWAVVHFVFSPPDLALVVRQSPLAFPSRLFLRLDNALDADSAQLTDSVARPLREIRGFLRDTRNYTAITLRNNTSRSMTNLDFRVQYVRELDGWGIEADHLTRSERTALVEAITYDYTGSLVVLRGIERLPPKSSLTVYLWGDVAFRALLGSEQVLVSYDGGAGKLEQEAVVRGVDAFIYQNAGFLFLILLGVNVAFLSHLKSGTRDPTNDEIAAVDADS